MEEITLYKGLFDLMLWICIYFVLLPAFKSPYCLKQTNKIIGTSLLLLFCLFPYWGGDYFHYRDSFEFVKAGGYNHYEDVYLWIITNLGYSYTFFRFIIWGSALALLLLSYKRIGSNYNLILFLFGSLYLLRFSYARVSLAMALLLLGISIIYNPIKKIRYLSPIIGIAITVVSVFFHRSAAIGIVAVLATLLLKNNSKKKVILIAILVPFIAFIVSYVLGNMLNMSFEAYDASLDGKIESYLTEGIAERGIAVKIYNFLLFTPMYLSVLAFITVVMNGDYKKFSNVERAFACYVFIVMMISIGLRLDVNHETTVVSQRVCYFAMPANAVFLMSLKSHRCISKLFKTIYWMALAASFYALMYSTYMGYNRM